MNEFFMTNFRCNTIWSIIIVIILLPTIVDAWGRSTQQFLLSSRWSTSTMLNMADDGSDRNRNDNNNNNEQSKIRILGVCGGIGSGKSMACKLLVSDLGCMAHIEADAIAHSVYQPGSRAIYDVVETFGSDILVPGKPQGQEEIDRKKLGAVVFSDPKSMSSLEHIVWPHVKTEILKQINEIKQQSASCTSTKHPVIVLEAAVLLDAGWDDLLDGVWVIQAPRDVAVERLIEYRSFTREDAEKRMDAQTSRRGIGNIDQEVKNGAVTAIVENTAGVEDLKIALLEKLQDSTAWKMSSD